VLFLLLSSGIARTATAQPSSNDARADALFKEGTKLLEEGKFAPACDKLAESRSLAPGLGVTMYLADCYESLGKTLEAHDLFRAAATMAHTRKDKREALANDRAAKLEATLPALVLSVASKDVVITIDGKDVPASDWASPIFVEAGKHAVHASAAGHKPFDASFDATNGARTPVTVPALDLDAAAPAPVAPSWPSTLQIVGIGLAGAGLVGVGVGSYFGLHAKSKLDDSNADGHCIGNRCDAVGLGLRSDGLDAARVANIGFIIGAVAIVAGAAVYVLGSR
jgi:serine/threonine-protein kinase